MPPPLGAASHLETISTLCKDQTIPKWYRARADIHRQTVQLINSVGSKASFDMRHSLIRVYESELDRVKNLYEDIWNDDLEIEWEGARLYLYGIAFVQPGPIAIVNNPETTLAAREVLLKGLAAAIGCLDTVMRMKLPPTLPGENRSNVEDRVYQLGFYPKHFFRIGAFANYYLLWFLNVDSEASLQDKDVAKTYITITYQLLTSFTHSFEHYRAGKAIELLANMPMNMNGPAVSSVNTRFAAGLMYSVAMNAEAGDHGLTVGGLGIDAVGPDGAHPKVVQHDPTIHRVTSQPTTITSPHSTFTGPDGSSPPQPPYDPRHMPYAQYGAGSTPTSTHSAPEPFRPMFQQHQSASSSSITTAATTTTTTPTQQAASNMAITMSPEQAMLLESQMEQMPAGSTNHVPPTEQAFMSDPMFNPAMLASMPNVNWEYPWGEWDASVLQHGVHQDPAGTSQYMGNMDLNARSYSG